MSALNLRRGAGEAVFDRRHFEHYTMHDQRLAAEVMGLFLAQLPSTLQLLEEAASGAAWKFAAHALKGSAAAVGAGKLHGLAQALEAMAFPGEDQLRLLRLQAVKAAAAEFREAVRAAYPAAGA